MADKVFGQDFTNITSPTGAETVSVLQSGALKDVSLANLVAGVTNNATSKATPVDADELPIIDSAASNVLKKLTWSNLKATLKTYFDTLYSAIADRTGWIEVSSTWTYASATTITVPSGAASIYSVGDKIKLTQTTVKYFYIVGVADTTLTITGGTSYTLTNAAISDHAYSKAATPVGFPASFTYTPTWAATGAAPSLGNGSIGATFKIVGREVSLYMTWVPGLSTTFGTGNYTFSLPVTLSSQGLDACIGFKAGALYGGTSFWNGSTTTFVIVSSAGLWGQLVPVTWANGDYIVAQYKYYI